MAARGQSAAEAVRAMRESEGAQDAQLGGPDPYGLREAEGREAPPKLECTHVVVIESPRCQAVNGTNGQRCNAKVAERLVYVRGVPELPTVRCGRCGTMQVFGLEVE